MKHVHTTPALAQFAAGKTVGPIGYRRDGRPIFPIAGGAPDDLAAGDDSPPADKTFTQAEVDAIVLKRAERVAADKYGDYTDLKTKAEQFDELQAAQASDLDKAIKKARDEASAEVRTEVTRERILDKIEVAAAGKFADVTDARLRVGQQASDFVKSDGSIDMAAIKAAVDKQLEDAPHLKVQPTGPQRPRADHTQGGDTDTPSKADQGRAEARKRFGPPTGQQ